MTNWPLHEVVVHGLSIVQYSLPEAHSSNRRDYHCGLIGYQVKKKSRPAASHVSSHFTGQSSAEQPVLLNQTSLDADRAKTGCTDVGVKQSITNSHGRSMQGKCYNDFVLVLI